MAGDEKDRLSQNGIRKVPVGSEEFTAWWSSDDANFKSGKPAQNIDAQTMKIINENGQYAASSLKHGTQVPIWQKARAATHQDNYPQQVISELDSINLRKDSFVFFDMEATGTLRPNERRGERMNFVSPTEMAIQHSKITQHGRAHILNDVNMVVAPGRNYKSLNTLLSQLEASPFQTAKNLSIDERRSLTDLILYSDASMFSETTIAGRKVKTIMQQARGLQPLDIADLSRASTIQKMRLGLHNLQTRANSPIRALEVMSDFFNDVINQTKGKTRIAGQNIRQYDLPVVKNMLNQYMVGKHRNNPKLERLMEIVTNSPYLDTLQVEKTLNTNIATKYPNLKLSSLAESRKVLNYKGKYITPGATAAHFAPYDVEVNSRVAASQIRQYRRLKRVGRTPQEIMGNHGFIEVNKNKLKAGDRLFAVSGVPGFEAGRFDAVYDEAYKPISTMKGSNPLYRNSTYNIHNFGQKQIGGKDMFTMTLFNEDRNTYHFFARDTMEEIQNLVHKNMDYLPHGKGADHKLLAKQSLEDAALRRYGKMFSTESGGGVNLYTRYSKALKAYNKHNGKVSETELEKIVRKAGGYEFDAKWNDASASFYRDFNLSKDRFAGEKKYYDKFLKTINANASFKGNKGAQNIALANYARKLDQVAGTNTHSQQSRTSVRSILPLTIDGTAVNVQVSDDIDNLQNSLSRAVGHGHVAKDMSMYTVKGRLLQIVNQMRAKDHIRGAHAKSIVDQINGLRNDDSAWYILRDISVAINAAHHDSKQGFGLRTIDVEDPTKLQPARAQGLEKITGKAHTELIKSVVDETMPYVHRAYDGIQVPTGSKVQQALARHDATMKIMTNHPAFAGSQVQQPRSAQEVLDDMVKRYVNKDFGTTLFHGGRDEITMAIYKKGMADSVKGMSYEEIMKNNHITTMSIPLMRENQNLRYGTQERLGRLKVVNDRGNSMRFITGFEEVVSSFSNMSNKVFGMMTEGKAIDATNLLRGVGRRTLENLSQNRTTSRRETYDDPFGVKESRGSNWARRGTVDFNDLAEKWWRENYAHDHEKQLLRIQDKMVKNPGMSFAEAMGGVTVEGRDGRKVDPGMRWALDMEGWLKNKGINVNTHSIKNTLVNNDVRSFHDVGELTPFGMYNPGAREKHFKVLNYLPLEEQRVRDNLKAAGYSDADADRMMHLGTTTKRGMEVFGDEVNYLSMRTAHANSGLVAKLGIPSAHTAEGGFVLRRSMASAFNTVERKDIRLSQGAELHDSIVKMFGGTAENPVNLNNTIMLESPISIQDAVKHHGLEMKDGKITVGGISRDVVTNGLAAFEVDPITSERRVKKKFYGTDFHEDQYLMQSKIKGWDAEKQSVVLEVSRNLEQGDKMLGSGGLRGTVQFVDDAILDRNGFGGIDAILPQPKLDHRDSGTILRGSVDLAYDETRRQVTAGKLALAEGLQTLQEVMSKHLGLKDTDYHLEQNRIVLSSYLGLDRQTQGPRNVFNFLTEMGTVLSGKAGHAVDLVNHTGGFMISQTGLAVSATPKWHDDMGAARQGEKGLVRWGLKERDILNDRLNRMATGDNYLGQELEVSATRKWLNSPDIERGVTQMMQAQTPDGPRMTNALTRTMLTANNIGGMRPGEVVIRTQANKGDFGPNNEGGRSYAHVDAKGVINVSGDNFLDVPSASRKGGFLTVGDLQQTMLTAHQSDLPIGPGGSDTVGSAIMRNHGTSLVELPEGLSHSHIRFISSDVQKVGASDMAVMNQLQRKENHIWRSIKAHANPGSTEKAEKVRDTLQSHINEYHDLAAKIQGGTGDGGIAKTSMSVMMDHSGRFTIQGINPTEVAGNGFEEATQYLGRNRVSRMLFKNKQAGMEGRLAEVLGIDVAGFNLNRNKHRVTVQNLVLDKITEEGLYGVVGRYPTNRTDTMNIHKIQIGKHLPHDYRGSQSLLATAVDYKADWDGDFNNISLSHYGAGDLDHTKALHKEMSAMQQVEQARIAASAVSPANDVDISKNYTVQDLARQDTIWGAQRGGMYDVESTYARVNSSLIGRADNMRYRLLNLSNDTTDILSRNGLIGNKEASNVKRVVQDFGATFSQNLISSKKFDVEDIAQKLGVSVHDPSVMEMVQQRQASMTSFMEGLQSPDTAGMKQMREAEKVLQLYKDTPEQFEQGLSKVHELYRLHGYSGNLLGNETLGLGTSSKDTAKLMGYIQQGQTNGTIGTPYVKDFMSQLDPTHEDTGTVKQALQRGLDMNEQNVLAGWNRMHGNIAFKADSTQLTDDMLGHTVAQDMGKNIRNLASQVFGGMGSGGRLGLGSVGMAATIFGGIWAGSSLMRSGPTPEGNQAQQEGRTAPVPKSAMPSAPTARVAPNEDINIRISGKNANQMSPDQISALVQNELNAMVPMGVNMNLKLHDNMQNIDKGWLQGVMANALNFGSAF